MSARLRKKHTGLKVFLWLLLLLVVLPIGLVYGLAYDSSGSAPSYDDGFNQETSAKKMAYASLDDTKTSGSMDFVVSQDDLNQILLHALSDKTSSIPGYEGAYVEITDTQYIFNFKIKPISIFATHLYLYSTFSSDDANYIFHIDDIKIGRLGGLTDLGMTLLSNYLSEDAMASMLSATGLSIKVSYASRNITYAKADLPEDLIAMSGLDSSSLGGGAITYLLNSSLLSLNFNSDKAIKASIDLSSLASNAAYSLPLASSSVNLDYSKYATALASLLNSGSVSLSSAQTVFDYFMFGYSSLSETNKSVVTRSLSGKDLTSIGITDLTAYEGLGYGEELDADSKMDEFKANVPTAALAIAGGGSTSLGSIKESDFSSLFENADIIGTSFLAIYQEGDVYHVNLVGIDDCYTNIIDDHLILTVGLSFNGYKTILVADLKDGKSSATDFKMELSFASLSFGNMAISLTDGNSIESGLYSALKSGLGGISWVSFDDANKEIIVDFTSLASSSGLTSLLSVAGLTPSLALKGADISAAGTLDFGVSK